MLEGIRRYSGQVFLDGEDGMCLHAYDVADAWAAKLAEIRAAVEAERVAALKWGWANSDFITGDTSQEDLMRAERAREVAAITLDALLAVAVAPEAEVAP